MQILPGGVNVWNVGENGAKSAGSPSSHKAVLVADQANQILPGRLFVGKNGKINAELTNRFFAVFDFIAYGLSMNLCLVDQIPTPKTL